MSDRVGRTCRAARSIGIIVVSSWLAVGATAGAEPEDLRPGLVATYRDAAASPAQFVQLEPVVALSLKVGEAPHPRLTANGGTARWQGYVNITRVGLYRFRAHLLGSFKLTVNGKEVLSGQANGDKVQTVDGPEVPLEAGVQSVLAEYSRPSGGGRVELRWQGPGFRDEPVPHDVLGHLPKDEPSALAHDGQIERGRFLVEEHNCTACHRPADNDRMGRGLVGRQGPDLSEVGRRVYAGWIDRWLEDPQKIRPGNPMPRLFADDEDGRTERHAVAAYLASLGGPLKEPPPADARKSGSLQGQRLFASIGCFTCHDGAQENRGKGSICAPPVVYPLKGLGAKTTPERLTQYLGNPLAFDPSGRMPHLLLDHNEAQHLANFLCADRAEFAPRLPEPPSAERLLTALKRIEKRTVEQDAFARQPAAAQLVDLGKRLVIEKGCNNCHTITPGGKPSASIYARATWNDLTKPTTFHGCLADQAAQRGAAPLFALDAAARASIRAFLLEGTSGPGSPAPAHAARVALQRFNCLACHASDGASGLTPELVEELRRVEKTDNAETVSPPTLTGVGHKLRTSALRGVLVRADRARPWMSLRMPQFGEANVGRLPEQLAALEGVDADDAVYKAPVTAASLEKGRTLIGKNAFGCISCHDMAGVPNSGTRGPDLAKTTQRVRYDWYRRWLEQPLRMQPGTRMPTVFLEGKSSLDTVLSGHADAQADAMWAYLALGPGLPLPDGLEPPKGLTLTVTERPVVLRTFMPEAGSRAFAVGYPGGVSVAFDAARCRLSYAWSGNFLDASPVWNDRGGSPAKPLGGRFLTMAAGCPVGVSVTSVPPDFGALARDPAYGAPAAEGKVYNGPRRLRFEGYRFTASGSPIFRYRIGAAEKESVVVEEEPEPLRSPVGVGLDRRFSLEMPSGVKPWLLAGESSRPPRVVDAVGNAVDLDWKGSPVEIATDRLLLLPQDGDRAIVLRAVAVPEGSRWYLHQCEGKWQVLLRGPLSAEPAKLKFNVHTWSLYRDEPALLKELLKR